MWKILLAKVSKGKNHYFWSNKKRQPKNKPGVINKKSYEAKLYRFALIRERIISFLTPFSDFFKSSTRSVFSNACCYVEGLFAAGRRNCQQIAEVSESQINQQQLHHLLSQAKWSASSLMDKVAWEFVQQTEQLSLHEDLQLIIDESGFAKKGKNSEGVSRQYNGSAGKIDNCQVGVFAALNAGSLTTLINAKLYKPESGTSKIDHALQLIKHTI